MYAQGDEEEVERLLSFAADLVLGSIGMHGCTALHIATLHNHIGVCGLLILRAAEVSR